MELYEPSARTVLGILLLLSIVSCDLERNRNTRDTRGKPRNPPRLTRVPRSRRPRLQDSLDRFESSSYYNVLRPTPPQTLSQEGYQQSLILEEEDEGEEGLRGGEDTTTSCPQGCPSSSGATNLTLTKEAVLELLQEVAHYLRASNLVLVARQDDFDSCISLAKSLYRRSLPTTCTTQSSLRGYHYALVFFANSEEDDDQSLDDQSLDDQSLNDQSIGSVLEDITRVTEAGRLQVLHLVFVATRRVTVPSVNASLSFCLIQPKDDYIEFREVLTFGDPPGPPAEDVVATWRPEGHGGRGGRRTREVPLPYRGDAVVPQDFRGNVVRVTAIEAAPYTIVSWTSSGEMQVKGYLVDLLGILQQQLNFTVKWIPTADNQFGVPESDGTWTGMVGQLHRQKVDIALTSLSRTIPRSKVIDFSPPIDHTKLRLLVYDAEDAKSIDWGTYVVIFHWSVWLTLVAVWIVMSVGLVFVARPSIHMSVYNYLFSFAGAFAQQGSEIVPPCPRGRTVFFTLWIGSVLVYTSYTARLTSQLAVIYTQDPFSSLTEALTTAGYEVAAQKGTAYITAMETARDKGLRLLYEGLQRNPSLMVQNNTAALEMMHTSKKKIAFFQDVNSINYYIMGDCAFSWYGQDYFPEYVYLGYQKNLSFANVFSYYIIKASDTGITPKLIKKWWGTSTSCTSSSAFQDLGFSKTISAFVLLALGILLGLFLLLVELYLHRLSPWRKKSAGNDGGVTVNGPSGLSRRKKTEMRGDSHRFLYEPHLRHL